MRYDDAYPCRICSCLIGDEVDYGDDWGEGAICVNCAFPPCPACNGDGEVADDDGEVVDCRACAGTGRDRPSKEKPDADSCLD